MGYDQSKRLIRSQSISTQILDMARAEFTKRRREVASAGDVLKAIERVGAAMGYSRMEVVTASAYFVLATKEQRELYGDMWPAIRNDCWIALANAGSMCETFERGSIVNVAA